MSALHPDRGGRLRLRAAFPTIPSGAGRLQGPTQYSTTHAGGMDPARPGRTRPNRGPNPYPDRDRAS